FVAAGGVGAVVLLRGGKHSSSNPAKVPVAQATTPAKTQPAKTEPKPSPKTIPVAATKPATQPAPPQPVPTGPVAAPAFHFMPKSAVLDELCELLFLHGQYHLF